MRKDNKGMTLIELLVAIAMLGVVVSPFLKTFTISARQNNKARETFRATTVAQNLMEGLRAFSLEEICTQVNNDVANTKLYMPNRYMGHMELENNAGEKSGEIREGKYIFKSTDSNEYELGICGIEEDGKIYDARILLDASSYPLINESDAEIEVDTMNEATDVIFDLSQNEEKEALKEWGTLDWNKIKRTFDIIVDKDNGNDKDKEKGKESKDKREVTVEVIYTNLENNKTITGKSLTKTVNELKNVYIYYFPNYNSKSGQILDYFDVRFARESFWNLNIVKQKYKDGTTGTDSTYVASLHVKDTNNMSDGRITRITLRTNIVEDLYNNASSYENALICSYKYAGEQDAPEVKRLLNYNGNLPQSLGGKKNKTNAIYDTTVQVFPEGTYPDHFDDTNPLAELSNKTR